MITLSGLLPLHVVRHPQDELARLYRPESGCPESVPQSSVGPYGALYMGSYLVWAAEDLTWVPAGLLHRRFLGWVR